MTDRRPAIYTRISNDPEGTEHGIRSQTDACLELNQRLGYPEPALYSDNDIGASNRTGAKPRPSYNRLLSDVRSGKINTILAYSNSRLTRRPAEWIELITLAESGALEIKTVVSGSHDLTTADGRAVALTVAAWDAAESERLGERQRRAYKHRALQGEPKLQRQRPFGWEKDGITIREDEAKWIRHGLKRILEGATITTVARELERAGVRTAAGRSEWGRTATLKVMTGWRAAGVRTYRETVNGKRTEQPLLDAQGQMVMGKWEPIITLEEREQALAMLTKHSRTMKQQGSWVLSGLLRCGACPKPLYGVVASAGRKARYACSASHNTIPALPLEEHVLEELRKHHKERWAKRKKNRRKLGPWPGQERLTEVQQKITELMEAYSASRLPASIVFAQVDALETERNSLQAEQAEYLAAQAEPEAPPLDGANPVDWLFQNEGMEAMRKPYPGEVSTERSAELASTQWEPELNGGDPVLGLDYDEGEVPPTGERVDVARLNEILKFYIDKIIVRKAQADGRKLQLWERVEILWRD